MADFALPYSFVIALLPLGAFLLIGLWVGRVSRGLTMVITLALPGASLLLALALAWSFFTTVLAHPELYPNRTLIAAEAAWLNFTPQLTGSLGVYLDPISVMMIVVITAIALMVNIYSVGYMRDDPGFGRFFALLNLFSFSMLGLVMSPNLLQMFVFWELVGVSSYALIGFWYQKPSAVAASKKAFIVTRFADAFFLVGIIALAFLAESFDFLTLNGGETAARLSHPVQLLGLEFNQLAVVGLLIFAGGWGKSAMFPLHIWLPDAMEGPTPVSSIIHSATMVVAGVFLAARMLPLFAASEVVLEVVRAVGVFTALFAAAIAVVQTDIKRILAFSTLSQLGYMMFSLGAVQLSGAAYGHEGLNPLGYSASMFHIFTHAFFKCLLFLGAGAVIHAVHSNEVEAMGGLRRAMPWTYWSLLAACLAIAGIPPLSGFWSKDAILLAAYQSGHVWTFSIGLLVGGLTAFYMFRFFFLIFHGPVPAERGVVHEDGWMTLPIVALAIPSVVAGYLCKDFFSAYFLIPLPLESSHLAHPVWLPVAAGAMGSAGLALAWVFYGRGDLALARRMLHRLALLHQLLVHKFYIDEGYLFLTRTVIFSGIAAPIKWFDRHIVDGAMNGVAMILQAGALLVRRVQNGQMTIYLGGTVLGIFFLYLFGRLPL